MINYYNIGKLLKIGMIIYCGFKQYNMLGLLLI